MVTTSKIQCLTPFLKIYKRMKVIITKKLYHELGIVNRSIRYIENIFFINFEWIQKDVTMHPPINVLVNLTIS
jgi:hypothetical protein